MRDGDLVWTRLEPVSKDPDMSEGLRGEVSDPLWMLTRQWQLGEFEGEDAGSAIDVSVDVAHDELSRFQLHGRSEDATPQSYEGEPLEAIAEREPITREGPGARLAVQAGRAFVRLLEREQSAGVEYDADDFPAGYRLTGIGDEDDQPMDQTGRRFADVVEGRVLDGHRVYQAIHEALDVTETWDANNLTFPWQESDASANPTELPVPSDASASATWFQTAARAFHEWYLNIYDEPTDKSGAAWDPERLDYRFRVATGGPDGQSGSTETVLEAPEYRGGELDWSDFDVANPTTDDGGWTPSGGEMELVRMALRAELGRSPLATDDGPDTLFADGSGSFTQRTSKHVMPTRASFKGMPKPRYWALEDADVRLDEVEVDDVSDQVMVNYALVYGNDWLTFPVDTPMGSLTRVTDLQVTDTFGVTERVPPVGQEYDDGDLVDTGDDWTAFVHENIPGAEAGEPGLFTPASLGDKVESDPVEQVSLVRDEMANLGFAVEQRMEGPTGDPVDRDEFVHADLAIESISPAADPAEEDVAFHNPGHEPLDIGGWIVTNGAETFTFPADTTVSAETTITLHTGTAPPGGGADTDYYWGASAPRWEASDPVVLSMYDENATDVVSGLNKDTDPNIDHLRLRHQVPGSRGGERPPERYRLATALPDHWFAMQPVKQRWSGNAANQGSGVHHYLELALVLDADSLDAATIAALPDPGGEILRPYPDDDTKHLSIPAEELPKGGKEITRSYQLAAWSDGTTHLWSGRQVRPGAGETGSSTLRFDVLENWRRGGGD